MVVGRLLVYCVCQVVVLGTTHDSQWLKLLLNECRAAELGLIPKITALRRYSTRVCIACFAMHLVKTPGVLHQQCCAGARVSSSRQASIAGECCCLVTQHQRQQLHWSPAGAVDQSSGFWLL
jgi:hypothetical protein